MNENASLKIWQTLQPMVRKEIAKGTESSVKSKKMVVTTAYNAATKTVGVKEAFGKEIQVPIAGTINPSSLTVGTAVWVVALHGSWSNAMVWMLGDGGNGDKYLTATGTAYNSDRLGGKTVSELMLAVYPVGSIYISVNNVSPATLFGGTWEQIPDRFLLGAGSSYAAGTTGGEANHVLTEAELPSHRHPSPQGTEASDYTYQLIRSLTTEATSRTQVATSTTSSVYALATKTTATDSIGTSDLLTASNTGYIGGGQAHNNMPPYLTVYMWKRLPDPIEVSADANGNGTLSGVELTVDENGNATTTAKMTVDSEGNATLG